MARKAKGKIGVSDLAAAWRAGWSPSDVNAILDRLDQIGDPNDPIPPAAEGETSEEDLDQDADETLDDEDDSEEDEDDSEEDEDDSEDEDVAAAKSNLEKLEQTALEVENNRLKKEIEKLQAANRRKDISGDSIKKSPEDSLIERFQSIF